jgi:hypothetical protein
MAREAKTGMPILDERVKWMTIGRFKDQVKSWKRLDIEGWKHYDEIWHIEDEAVLVPMDLWMRIQEELLKTSSRQ